MKLVDIIIPVKNEEKNLAQLVSRLSGVMENSLVAWKMIIVDDHSTDQTLNIALELAKTFPLEIHSKLGKPGKAYSILEGVKYSTAEYIVMIDGDLQYPPEVLPQMIQKLEHTGAVVAERKVYKSTLFRRLASRVNRFLFGQLLFGLNCDIQSGLKAFRREIFAYLDESLVGPWSIDIPLLYQTKMLGYEIGSVDIIFELRENGASKIDFIDTALEIALGALKLKLKTLSKSIHSTDYSGVA